MVILADNFKLIQLEEISIGNKVFVLVVLILISE